MIDDIENDRETEETIDSLWISVTPLAKLKLWSNVEEICNWLAEHMVLNSRLPLRLVESEALEKAITRFRNNLLNGLKARALRNEWTA